MRVLIVHAHHEPFMFTTPEALSPASETGSFLVKDLILLGAGILTAGEALGAAKRNNA